MTARRGLTAALLLLAMVITATATLGPLVLGVLRYHTSPTTLNQLIGADAAALAVVVPWTVAAALLCWRGHPAGPVLALPPAVFAVYTFTQLVVGQEYLRLPGNNERFFPLLYAGFLLGVTIAVAAWPAAAASVPRVSRRASRVAGLVLLAVAVFLVLQHLPSFTDALRDHPARTEYVSSPTPFWLVKLMDLGLVVPAAVTTGVGLLRERAWARTPGYVIIGAYTLLGASVASMGITMLARYDPDASVAVTTGFTLFALGFAALTAQLYRPLFGSGRSDDPTSGVDPQSRKAAPQSSAPAGRHH